MIAEKLATFFKFEENRTTLSREISGGVVTFLTMPVRVFPRPASGFIACRGIKRVSGRFRELNLILILITILFMIRILLIRV